MTIEQTVEIPAVGGTASRRLTIDVPPEVPAGRATILIFRPAEEAAGERRRRHLAAIEKCWGIAKGIASSDDILENRRKDKELEDAKYRCLFGEGWNGGGL